MREATDAGPMGIPTRTWTSAERWLVTGAVFCCAGCAVAGFGWVYGAATGLRVGLVAGMVSAVSVAWARVGRTRDHETRRLWVWPGPTDAEKGWVRPGWRLLPRRRRRVEADEGCHVLLVGYAVMRNWVLKVNDPLSTPDDGFTVGQGAPVRLSKQLYRRVSQAREYVGTPLAFQLPVLDGLASGETGLATHCVKCRYPLLGLHVPEGVGVICPECGTAVPAGGFGLFGFAGPGRPSNDFSTDVLQQILGAAAFMAIWIGLTRLARTFIPTAAAEVINMVMLGLVFGSVVLWTTRRRKTPERPPPREAELPRKLAFLVAGPEGVGQQGAEERVSWEELEGVRVQRWPGGARVTAKRRRGETFLERLRRWFDGGRVVDFVVPCGPGHVKTLRRLVQGWARAR